VVQGIAARVNGVQVVVENQHDRPVDDAFGVDVCINPDPAGTLVN